MFDIVRMFDIVGMPNRLFHTGCFMQNVSYRLKYNTIIFARKTIS